MKTIQELKISDHLFVMISKPLNVIILYSHILILLPWLYLSYVIVFYRRTGQLKRCRYAWGQSELRKIMFFKAQSNILLLYGVNRKAEMFDTPHYLDLFWNFSVGSIMGRYKPKYGVKGKTQVGSISVTGEVLLIKKTKNRSIIEYEYYLEDGLIDNFSYWSDDLQKTLQKKYPNHFNGDTVKKAYFEKVLSNLGTINFFEKSDKEARSQIIGFTKQAIAIACLVNSKTAIASLKERKKVMESYSR